MSNWKIAHETESKKKIVTAIKEIINNKCGGKHAMQTKTRSGERTKKIDRQTQGEREKERRWGEKKKLNAN